MARRNIKLTIAYNGCDYHGWQIQPGSETIQGIVTEAMSSLVGHKVHVCGASRTDAGVSALGQVALVELDSPIPTENLAGAITDRLPRDIVVSQATEIPFGADIIRDVKSKLYRYTIFTGPIRPVLDIRNCWHVGRKLDVGAMARAAALLVGKKDFKSFASAGDKRDSSVRTIFRCDVTAESQWVYVEVEGDGFLYNMVRNIVGTLVEIGVGRWPVEEMGEILEARDRTAAGPIAPPQGLCLMWIRY